MSVCTCLAFARLQAAVVTRGRRAAFAHHTSWRTGGGAAALCCRRATSRGTPQRLRVGGVGGGRMHWLRRARPQRSHSSTPRSIIRAASGLAGSSGRCAGCQRLRPTPTNPHLSPTPARPPRRPAPPGRAPGRSSCAAATPTRRLVGNVLPLEARAPLLLACAAARGAGVLSIACRQRSARWGEAGGAAGARKDQVRLGARYRATGDDRSEMNPTWMATTCPPTASRWVLWPAGTRISKGPRSACCVARRAPAALCACANVSGVTPMGAAVSTRLSA